MMLNKKGQVIEVLGMLFVVIFLGYIVWDVMSDADIDVRSARAHCESLGYEDWHLTPDRPLFKCVNYVVDPITKEKSLNTTGTIRFDDVRLPE